MKDRLRINLLETGVDKVARRMTVVVAAIFTLLVGSLATLGAGASYRAANHGTDVFSEVGHFFAFSELKRLITGDEAVAQTDLLKTPDGRLNILLLGIGGTGHEGPQLTDTIIFASFDKNTDQLGLVSLPRDLAFPLGGGRFQKINSVNAYYEVEHPGEGAKLTAEAFEKLLGVRIDRVVKIDFAGFEKLVDALGGIDVKIENSFTDNSFPTDTYGPNPYKWTSVRFEKGMEHMNGKRALTFVRSRHGTNGESSDFARSRRQQIVLSSIREKLLSLGTLSNPKTITDIWSALSSNINTDLTAWDAIKLAPSLLSFSSENIINHVLTDAPGGELVAGNIDGAFMLFPRKADWSEIREIVMDPFASAEAMAEASHPQEKIQLEIKNGTTRTGYAGQVASTLEKSGYVVSATSNAKQRGYERTVIYDLTNGAKPNELARLKKILDANVATTAPDGKILLSDGKTNESISETSTQFLIILGESSINLVSAYPELTNP
ncbi:MAG: LCP family protein [Patescibacteria group bacterium]